MPRQAWTGYHRFCPLARGLDILGERWTLVIVQELSFRPHRYGELLDELPGISSGVLTDRLRKLEQVGLVERRPGAVGEGVLYALTATGEELNPALAALRQFGVRMLTQTDLPPSDVTYDMRYARDQGEEPPAETFEWRVGGTVTTLVTEGSTLTQHPGPADDPSVVVEATPEFMRRWSAGGTTLDAGRAAGDVVVTGSEAAWERMLVATAWSRVAERGS